MQKPSYKIKLGSQTIEPSSATDIVGIEVDLALDVPIDICKILVNNGPLIGAVKRGDEVSVELGFDGSNTKVFTGGVDSVDPAVSGATITCLSLASLLARKRINQVYEKQAAGAIVEDIAGRAGLAVKEPDDGLSFPSYVIDDSKTAYQHLRELAELSGCDLFLNAEGHLIFKKYEEQKPITLRYGRDIVDVSVQETNPRVSGVRVFEESPASSMGDDTSHWLSKKTMGGSCGDEDGHLITNPAIRDKDTADQVARNYLEKHAVSLSGTVKAIGVPKAGLCSTIRIKEAPDARMNGDFKVVRVTHTFGGERGFMSAIEWVRPPKVSKSEPPVVEKPPVPAPPKKPSFMEEMLQKARDELESAREALVEALDAAESSLDEMLRKVSEARTEIDRMADQLLKEADAAHEQALAAAREPLSTADGLKEELEKQKAQMLRVLEEVLQEYQGLRQMAADQVAECEQDYNEIRLQIAGEAIESSSEELKRKLKEAEGRLTQAREELEKIDDEIEKASEEGKKKIEDTAREAQAEIDAARKTAEDIIAAANEDYSRARKKADDAKREANEAIDSLNKAYGSAREAVMEGRKMAGLE
ncbi:phage late control D family protein [Methanocella arvoryzae]|uniref:Uncharacterized protein n=1 Tax=Methanocella arvoryzae (strain DSM 22066 / NBRC 105507 / MRE50) TaxID=351160 RepID=Q0W3Z8_METAR|nr:hypothetical protein [Methanocella arvoryzae]CAJ36895.1 hypothetical protein RCIX1667 [Methanocella arvoryzae MRE50]